MGLMINRSGRKGGNSYHDVCYHAKPRCFLYCKCPQRNCVRLHDWILTHGPEALPVPVRSLEDHFFHAPVLLV